MASDIAKKDYIMKIDYRYLNLVEKRFYPTQGELVQSLCAGSHLMAIPNYKYNQVLVAGSIYGFTRMEAIITCKRLLKGKDYV